MVVENAVGDTRAVCADCADVIDWPVSDVRRCEVSARGIILRACRDAGRFCGEHARRAYPDGGFGASGYFDASGYFQDWLDESPDLCDGGYSAREWIAMHNDEEPDLCIAFCDALREAFESERSL
jgi:hypothetical protein